MSVIAQKLCSDIVHPILKPPSNESRKVILLEKSVNTNTNVRNNVKPKQNVQTEKKKTNKFESPRITGLVTPRLRIGDKQTKKNLVHSAINTLFSGPLRCDNNCVTLIHKRNQNIPCKCLNAKGSSKEIQTSIRKNYSILDKSCTQCIETVSCGTQFKDNVNGILKGSSHKSKSKTTIKIKDSIDSNRLKKKITAKPALHQDNLKINVEKSVISKPSKLRYVSAKHWALSNYPIRGPDF